MTIHQYRAVWSGFSGSPGYTLFNFHYPTEPTSTPNLCTAIGTFWNSVKTTLPSTVTVTTESQYKVLDEVTGSLIDILTDGAVDAGHTGVGSGAYSGRVGACLNLKTATVIGSRRARGRLFLVPLAGAEFSATGRLGSGVGALIIAAANALRDDTALAPWSVWHRPASGAGGQAAPITSFSVNDEGAVLRTRAE